MDAVIDLTRTLAWPVATVLIVALIARVLIVAIRDGAL